MKVKEASQGGSDSLPSSEVAKAHKKGPPVIAHPDKCTGCLICQLRCSWRFEKAFNLNKAAIQIHRLAGQNTEFAISFTPLCDNCGICARYCPYQALNWTKRKETS